jgi:hypothetical protein
MQGGSNMNMGFNQKFMSCEDRGIRFSLWLHWEYAPSTFDVFILPSGTFGDSTFHPVLWGFPLYRSLNEKRSLFQRFNCDGKPNFRYRRDKKYTMYLHFIVVR